MTVLRHTALVASLLALAVAAVPPAHAGEKSLFPDVFKDRPSAKASRLPTRGTRAPTFGVERAPRIIDMTTTGSTTPAAPSPAQSSAPAAATPESDSMPAPVANPQPSDNAGLYCQNIVDIAVDARYTRQADALAALEKALEERVAELEAKRADLQKWVDRREELLKNAEDSVVQIYAQMRPDAAALQFAAMERESAAAILAKLKPRVASAILNEMDAATAAQLTNTMAGQSLPEKVAARSP